jgi:hypothetical protein
VGTPTEVKREPYSEVKKQMERMWEPESEVKKTDGRNLET